MRQSWETMTSVSANNIILTPTQPVGSGRPHCESNPVPPHQESRTLPTELQRPRLRIDRQKEQENQIMAKAERERERERETETETES